MIYLRRRWALLVRPIPAEAVPGASNDFIGEFALGRGQRNELAAAQFNKNEVVGLLDCSFRQPKKPKNKSENLLTRNR